MLSQQAQSSFDGPSKIPSHLKEEKVQKPKRNSRPSLQEYIAGSIISVDHVKYYAAKATSETFLSHFNVAPIVSKIFENEKTRSLKQPMTHLAAATSCLLISRYILVPTALAATLLCALDTAATKVLHMESFLAPLSKTIYEASKNDKTTTGKLCNATVEIFPILENVTACDFSKGATFMHCGVAAASFLFAQSICERLSSIYLVCSAGAVAYQVAQIVAGDRLNADSDVQSL